MSRIAGHDIDNFADLNAEELRDTVEQIANERIQDPENLSEEELREVYDEIAAEIKELYEHYDELYQQMKDARYDARGMSGELEARRADLERELANILNTLEKVDREFGAVLDATLSRNIRLTGNDDVTFNSTNYPSEHGDSYNINLTSAGANPLEDYNNQLEVPEDRNGDGVINYRDLRENNDILDDRANVFIDLGSYPQYDTFDIVSYSPDKIVIKIFNSENPEEGIFINIKAAEGQTIDPSKIAIHVIGGTFDPEALKSKLPVSLMDSLFYNDSNRSFAQEMGLSELSEQEQLEALKGYSEIKAAFDTLWAEYSDRFGSVDRNEVKKLYNEFLDLFAKAMSAENLDLDTIRDQVWSEFLPKLAELNSHDKAATISLLVQAFHQHSPESSLTNAEGGFNLSNYMVIFSDKIDVLKEALGDGPLGTATKYLLDSQATVADVDQLFSSGLFYQDSDGNFPAINNDADRARAIEILLAYRNFFSSIPDQAVPERVQELLDLFGVTEDTNSSSSTNRPSGPSGLSIDRDDERVTSFLSALSSTVATMAATAPDPGLMKTMMSNLQEALAASEPSTWPHVLAEFLQAISAMALTGVINPNQTRCFFAANFIHILESLQSAHPEMVDVFLQSDESHDALESALANHTVLATSYARRDFVNQAETFLRDNS